MTLKPFFPPGLIEDLTRAALAEDLGRAGDLTSQAVVPAEARARAVIAAREPGVVAGLALAREAFRQIDPEIGFESALADGGGVAPGGAIAFIEGPARGVLAAERVALNFLGRLCGVASLTARYAGRIAHTKAKVCDTRKTTPLLRALEKYAVRCGGGANHRFGLDDAILIKDNHIAVAGGVGPALRAAKAYAGHLTKIEIEVESLEQLEQALEIGVDAILLDNMPIATMRQAVEMIDKRAVVEASGGVTLETIAPIAETGVDLISVGALTHSARALDIGLDMAV
ncbi:carboxylating nicotinate-nucleotide diphosphorylase [Methylocystis bryophila]|uniref:Probable nicotinate-nucleotide pyrophosphorylase [carboxylating] n=1 Tax=Methylocystis bryophila TaxID=655015 RepID=A0A1W6MYS2_9HYPH|nr:carboxylating nicotinate-nucleotide diphosphorylase [Methylocystis bryophila]ARN82740.1 nicotinate-nucleotide diphosphorylase (carboxylating) [Methylocystis bryophila]BDV38975.1 nicotinate-nucleotide pyrophosphorylase [carboxylating] [Methylocystis bryophila]